MEGMPLWQSIRMGAESFNVYWKIVTKNELYANYVVQHVIEHQQQGSHRRALLKVVTDNVLSFSQHKFGSNVVEACLKYGTGAEREALIEGMLRGQSPALGTRGSD
mmetsp:Transcript_4975/g.5835  ORF Transcript_4975/g.5835 Transcript_4975/m.5835 type:complete len:106 (-) Transcript_4975:39-356(-)